MPEGQTGGVCGKNHHFGEISGVYELPQSQIFDFCQLPQNEGAEGAPAPGATIRAAQQTPISSMILSTVDTISVDKFAEIKRNKKKIKKIRKTLVKIGKSVYSLSVRHMN